MITVYSDRSFTFITKTPPASVLLKKAAGIRGRQQGPEPRQGRQGDPRAGRGDRPAQDAGPDCGRSGSRGADHRRQRAQHGHRGGGALTWRSCPSACGRYASKLTPGKQYPMDEALALLKELASAKFMETVEAAVNLGVDPRKSDQVVRGSTVMPHGTGKTARVAVFAQGAASPGGQGGGRGYCRASRISPRGSKGASWTSMWSSRHRTPCEWSGRWARPRSAWIDAEPQGGHGDRRMWRVRSGMPRPVRSVTVLIRRASSIARSARFLSRWACCRENLQALLADLQKAKPSTAKGTYMKRVTVSTTMGPGSSGSSTYG